MTAPHARGSERCVEWSYVAVEGEAVPAKAMATDRIPLRSPGDVRKRQIEAQGNERRVEHENREGGPVGPVEPEAYVGPARHGRVETQAAIDQPRQDENEEGNRDEAGDRRKRRQDPVGSEEGDDDQACDENLKALGMVPERPVLDAHIAQEVLPVPDLGPGRPDPQRDDRQQEVDDPDTEVLPRVPGEPHFDGISQGLLPLARFFPATLSILPKLYIRGSCKTVGMAGSALSGLMVVHRPGSGATRVDCQVFTATRYRGGAPMNIASTLPDFRNRFQ